MPAVKCAGTDAVPEGAESLIAELFLIESRPAGGDWIRYPVIFPSVEDAEAAVRTLSGRGGRRRLEYRLVAVVLTE